jgi:putative DNA primase/helicase
MLAFWTGPDPERIDKLFRHSGLYRRKWERKDYRERTIARALEGRTEFYEPGQMAPLKDNSVKCDSEEITIEKALEGPTEVNTTIDDKWEDPVPLPEGLPPVAPLDPTMLPEPLRGWIIDVSERMQIPPDFAAAGAIVVAGSLIGRKLGIHPKRQDDWLVVPNLWGAVVGRPSLLKSPALAEVMRPLGRLVVEAYEEYQEAKLAYETDVIVAEATKAALKVELKKVARETAKGGDRSRLEEIARRNQDTEGSEEPVLKRYKTEDSTVEKISELLLENPRGILVHRDELSGWLRNLEKQGREGDRSFYLESWNGTGSFDVDRIGRGSQHIPALCLSILGSIQPGPLSSYVYQATQGEKGDDGLLQRFQLLVWPDPSPIWRNVDRWPDVEAKNRAYEVFKRLDALDPEDFGADGEVEEGIPAVRFTWDAQEIFDQWRDDLEVRLRTAELPPALESHLAKYRSLMPSLALVFQLIECVDGRGEGDSVGLRGTLQAAAWCEYLETHAARLYSSAENPAMEGARALLDRIRKGDVQDGDPTRSVYRKHWAKLSTPEEVNSACQVLEEFGWLRIEVAKTSGRSTTRLRLHPILRDQP